MQGNMPRNTDDTDGQGSSRQKHDDGMTLIKKKLSGYSEELSGHQMTELMLAAYYGEIDEIHKILKQDEDIEVNKINNCRNNALHYACMSDGDLKEVVAALYPDNSIKAHNQKNEDENMPFDLVIRRITKNNSRLCALKKEKEKREKKLRENNYTYNKLDNIKKKIKNLEIENTKLKDNLCYLIVEGKIEFNPQALYLAVLDGDIMKVAILVNLIDQLKLNTRITTEEKGQYESYLNKAESWSDIKDNFTSKMNTMLSQHNIQISDEDKVTPLSFACMIGNSNMLKIFFFSTVTVTNVEVMNLLTSLKNDNSLQQILNQLMGKYNSQSNQAQLKDFEKLTDYQLQEVEAALKGGASDVTDIKPSGKKPDEVDGLIPYSVVQDGLNAKSFQIMQKLVSLDVENSQSTTCVKDIDEFATSVHNSLNTEEKKKDFHESLHHMIFCGYTSLAKALIKVCDDQDLNVKIPGQELSWTLTDKEISLLGTACYTGEIEIIDSLITKGLQPTKQDLDLLWSAINGCLLCNNHIQAKKLNTKRDELALKVHESANAKEDSADGPESPKIQFDILEKQVQKGLLEFIESKILTQGTQIYCKTAQVLNTAALVH